MIESTTPKSVPPRSSLNKFGDTLSIVHDLLAFQTGKHEKYGNAYNVSFLFQPGISFCDPEVAREVLSDRKDAFSSAAGWERTLGVFFQNGLLLRDFDDHLFHRKLMQQVFRGPAMERYVELMSQTISKELETWPAGQPFKAFPLIKTLTLKIAARSFLGISIDQQSSRLVQVFSDLIAGSTTVVRLPVIGRGFARAHEARKYLEKFLGSMIPEKRQKGGEDLLAQLCLAKDEKGEFFSDQEVIDHIIFLLFAAHDTITSVLTHILYYLSKYPQWQDRLREQAIALPSGTPNMGELEKWAEADQVLYETLRLHPPVPAIPRKALRDCEVAGYKIPAGNIVWLSVLYQQRMPKYWKNGSEFDPDRFSAARSEQKQHPYLWIPYGGGPHICLGKQFSRLQVKLFLKHFLSRWKVQMIREDYRLKVRHLPIVKPQDNLPILIHPLSHS